MKNITLSIIKPDGIRRNLQGKILDIFLINKFKILQQKLMKFNKELAAKFYEIHKNRPFFQDLCNFMCSGVVSVQILEKENAVLDYRNLIGATDPAKASVGTLRYIYGISIDENTLHGSDSDENAIIESKLLFE